MQAQGDKLPELRVGAIFCSDGVSIHLYSGDIDCDFDISCEVTGALQADGLYCVARGGYGFARGCFHPGRAPRHGSCIAWAEAPALRRQWLQEAGVQLICEGVIR